MTLLHVADLVGVAVFAVSGALSAGRKRLDLLGVVVIASLTAVGGGTLRDLLLNRHPIFWLVDSTYLVVIIAAALGVVIWTRMGEPPRHSLAVADAFGLALFTISGARIAEQVGLPRLSVVLMGAMTGAAGGVLRDVLSREIPLILRRDLYATAAILGATLYLTMEALGFDGRSSAITGMVMIVLLRLAAIAWKWGLPVFTLREGGGGDGGSSA
ncbi:MAG: trimeric intracellular cation channel family protein [Gemmatimonadota bacterium]|nr:trimeric intracellular cation channel family protein [Gemmatimonadota bacterium]